MHDEEKPFELELSWVCEETNNEFRRVPADLVKEAEDAAKAALADSDMCGFCLFSSLTKFSVAWHSQCCTALLAVCIQP